MHVKADAMVLDYLKRVGETTVTEMYYELAKKDASLSRSDTTDTIWRLHNQGKVDLQDMPIVVTSFDEYVKVWERNLWFYGSLLASLLALLSIYLLPQQLPFLAVRWILGSVFVLFMPGFVAVEALFPNSSEMDLIERVALSIGLSLTLVPLVGLMLNFTTWGITLQPIVTALSILTFGLAGVAFARQYASAKKV